MSGSRQQGATAQRPVPVGTTATTVEQHTAAQRPLPGTNESGWYTLNGFQSQSETYRADEVVV